MFAVVIFVSAILASLCAAKRPPCFYEKLGAGSYDTCYTVKFGCNYCYLDFDETASKLENGELCTRPEEDIEAEEQICRDFNTWVDCLKTNVGKKNDSEEVKAKKICKATANYTARGWGEHCGNPCQLPLTTLPTTSLPMTKANSEPTAPSFETTLATGSTKPVSPEVTSDSTLGTANTDPISQSATSETTQASSTTEPASQNPTSETTSDPISTVPVSQTGTSETTMAPGTTEPASQNPTSETSLGTVSTEPVSQSGSSESTSTPDTTEPVTQSGTSETTQASSTTEPASQNPTSETTSDSISTVPVSQTGTSETTMAQGTTEPASQNPTSETSLGTVSTEPVSHSGSSESTSTPGTTEPATQNPTVETTLGTVSNEPVSHVVTSESTSMPTETVTTTEPLSTAPSQSPSPTQCAKDEHYEVCAIGREIKCDDIRPGANVTKLNHGACAFTGCMCNSGLVRENNNECVTLDKCQKTGPTTTEPVSHTPITDTTSGPISTVPVSQHDTSEITLTPGATEPATQSPTSETTLAPGTTETASQNPISESTSTPGTMEPATQSPTSKSTSTSSTTEPASHNPTSESTSTPSTTEPATQSPTSETTSTPSTMEPATQSPTSETTLGPSSTEPVSHEVTSESTSAPTETVTTTEQLSTVSSGSPTPTQCREDEHYEACGKHREIKCDDIRPNVNSSNAVRGDCVFIGCMCNPGLVRENNNECVGIEKCREVTSESTSAPTTESLSTVPSQSPTPTQCPKDEHYEACAKGREIKCDDIRPGANVTKLNQGDCAFTGCMCDPGLVRENNNECISIEKCQETVRSTTEPVTQKATSEPSLGPGTTEPVSQTVTSETKSSSGTTEPIKEFTLEPIPTLPASEKVSSEPSMERHIPQCPKDEHYEACYQWREIKCDDILDKLNGTKLRAFRSLTSDCAFIGCMCDAGLVRENNNECISVEKCRGTAR